MITIFIGRFNIMKKINYYDILSKSQNEKFSIIYNAFMDYAKNKAKFIHDKHDMSLEYCAMYISENLYFKFMELREHKIASFGGYYMNVEFESYIHTLGIAKNALLSLNTVKAGVYSDEHYATNETEYLPNMLLSKVDSRLLNRPTVSSSKTLDIVDLCNQWENRHARSESRLNKMMSVLNGSDLLLNDGDFSLNIYDYLNSITSANYETPENILIGETSSAVYNRYVDDKNTLAMYIDDIKQEKNFSKVAEVLRHGEKTSADKMTIKRFKNRHGFKMLSLADLKTLFL